MHLTQLETFQPNIMDKRRAEQFDALVDSVSDYWKKRLLATYEIILNFRDAKSGEPTFTVTKAKSFTMTLVQFMVE